MTTDFFSGEIGHSSSSPIQAGSSAPSGIVAGSANSTKRPENSATLAQRQILEIEGLNRKIGALMAHLNQTCMMLEVADARIAGQKARIAMLEDLTTTDDLTGIKNRRGFQELFQREIESCNRGLSKGGLLIMIDLDNFKSLNDKFGHLAGDAALKLVARTLIGEIRKTDVAGRFGGDEFILLLSNTSQENAAAKAQSIASHLNNLSIAWYGDVIHLQASIGIKSFGSGDNPDAILQAADGTMYARKSARKSEKKS